MAHWSSCSTNNGPALPAGDCDCGDNADNVILFVPRPDPNREERLQKRMIEAAQAIYESIFPTVHRTMEADQRLLMSKPEFDTSPSEMNPDVPS